MKAEIENISGLYVQPEILQIIKNVLSKGTASEDLPAGAEVCLLIACDSQIQEYNFRHRGINTPTDVLSFPMINFAGGEQPNQNPYILGDIIISYERAVKQAEELGHTIDREIGFLTAHGILHLMGYDHKTPQEEEEMTKKQESLLKELGLCR